MFDNSGSLLGADPESAELCETLTRVIQSLENSGYDMERVSAVCIGLGAGTMTAHIGPVAALETLSAVMDAVRKDLQ